VDQWPLLAELCPLRRDLVSDGFDAALRRLAELAPLVVHEYPSGTRCWTWTVPRAWTCRAAYVETLDGRRVIDQAVHPLHVAAYSRRIDAIVTREELRAHLHTHAVLPDAVPFIFHYYRDDWSFCCTHAVKEALAEERYRVVIDSAHEDGALKVGEWHLPGERPQCVVLAAHLDHAVQANDGLSGVVTALAVMDDLARLPRRTYSYRLLVTAESIGAVAWLSAHEGLLPSLAGGLFLDMTGVDVPAGLQLSYGGDTPIDRCFRAAHAGSEQGAWIAPYRGLVGNDERQFNAPGVRVPMLAYARALPWGHPQRPYPAYHSSADTVASCSPERLARSAAAVRRMIDAWEANWTPRNLFKGEVFLSGVGLAVDRHRDLPAHRAMLRITDMIDGTNSVADIALALELDFFEVLAFLGRLRDAGLVAP
jgi:aminopeptidase-like protein